MKKRETNCVVVPVETMNWVNDFIDCIKDCGKIEHLTARLIIDKLNREVELYIPQESSDLEDGIYLCYEGGKRQLYDGTNPTERVDHIGIKVGTHMVGLCLNSQGEHELPYNSDLDKDDFDHKRQHCKHDKTGQYLYCQWTRMDSCQYRCRCGNSVLCHPSQHSSKHNNAIFYRRRYLPVGGNASSGI